MKSVITSVLVLSFIKKDTDYDPAVFPKIICYQYFLPLEQALLLIREGNPHYFQILKPFHTCGTFVFYSPCVLHDFFASSHISSQVEKGL
jgi:hypothetical protein